MPRSRAPATPTVGVFIDQDAARTRIMNETFVRNAIVTGDIRTAYLPVSELFVDNSYQRHPQDKINRIAAAWDDRKCGFLRVSYRQDVGKFAVIDGQNRMLAAKQLGKVSLPCQIYTDLTVAQEAELFATQSVNCTLVSSYDKFRAELVAGNPSAVALNQICDSFGIRIYKAAPSVTGVLRGLEKAKDLYASYGQNCLMWIFRIIHDCGWHNVEGAYGSKMIRALGTVYANHRSSEDSLTRARVGLTTLFEPISPRLIEAKAQTSYITLKSSAALVTWLERWLETGPDGRRQMIHD